MRVNIIVRLGNALDYKGREVRKNEVTKSVNDGICVCIQYASLQSMYCTSSSEQQLQQNKQSVAIYI